MPSTLTKRALVRSLLQLMKMTPLSKISVTDICEDCGISRQTFYYHFEDIFQLLEWACEEESTRVLEDNRSATTWQRGLYNILCMVQEHRDIVSNVYHSVQRDQLERYLFKVTRSLIGSVCDEHARAAGLSAGALDFIADFYKYAFVGSTLDWIGAGMRQDPQELVDHMSFLMDGQIERVVERMRLTKGGIC